jgi:cytoskeleton-associated protein 5
VSAGPPKAAGKSAPAESLKYKYSQEDAEAQAASILPPEILEDLANSQWKPRLAAIESLHDWLGGEGSGSDAEIVTRYLSKKPGWKESNFQVCDRNLCRPSRDWLTIEATYIKVYGKMIAIFQLFADQSPSFSKACAAITIPPLSDKLGDIKLKKPAGDALLLYAEKTSLQFVLSQGMS